MKVLVAGATGVIGRATVRELAGAGHEVVGLVRQADGAALVQRDGGTPAVGDLLRAETLTEAASGAAGIVHVATAIPRTSAPTAEHWGINDRVRREGTANLVHAARAAGSDPLFVHASVYLVYGNDCGDRVVDERDTLNPPPVIESAVDAEEHVRRAGSEHGLRWVILRPGWLYAQASWHTQQLLNDLTDGRAVVLTDAPAWRSPVHAVDVAAAVRLCLEQQPLGAIFNVADDEPVPTATLLDGLATRLGVAPPERISSAEAQERYGAGGLVNLTRSVRLATGLIAGTLGFRARYPTWREGFEAVFASRRPD